MSKIKMPERSKLHSLTHLVLFVSLVCFSYMSHGNDAVHFIAIYASILGLTLLATIRSLKYRGVESALYAMVVNVLVYVIISASFVQLGFFVGLLNLAFIFVVTVLIAMKIKMDKMDRKQ